VQAGLPDQTPGLAVDDRQQPEPVRRPVYAGRRQQRGNAITIQRTPLDRDGVAALLAAARAHWTAHGFGLLAITDRETGRLVGETGLHVLEDGPDVEVGYTLARAAWGRGYATEAATAVLRWGFAGLRLHRVVAVADPANHASLHVLDKLGMARRGMRDCYGARMVEYAESLVAWRESAGPAPARR
jgi:ribosomal-protein-alanine N-acetyltransferase